MSAPVTITRLDLATPGLASAVLALQLAAYHVEARLLGVEDLPPLAETEAQLVASHETFLAEWAADGRLAGVLGYEACGGEVEICRLMVDPLRFRQGIATRLLQALEAEEPDWRVMTVTTGSGNLPALALYRRQGFEVVASRPVRPGLRLVTMSRQRC